MSCTTCGKKLSFIEKARAPCVNEREGQKRFCSSQCFKQYLSTFESRKTCSKCAYFEKPKMQLPDKQVFIEDPKTHLPNREGLREMLAARCKKFDLELEPSIIEIFEGGYAGMFRRRDFYLDAEKCVHCVTKEEYKQKALKGEVRAEKEAYYLVCKYCQVRYDANKNVKCPNCGATNP